MVPTGSINPLRCRAVSAFTAYFVYVAALQCGAKFQTETLGGIMAGSEYRKRQEGDGCVFEVTPAQAPKFLILAFGGAILILFALIGGLGLVSWIIFIPIGALGIWAGYFRDARPAAYRSPSSFRVNPAAIEANGRTFPKGDIHRLIIKNGVSNEVLGSPNLLIPVSTSTAMGMAHRAQVSTVANALEVETGGKGYVLAGGMDQTTAFGLLHDVSKVLGFSTT